VVVDREKGEANMSVGRVEIGGHVIEVADSGNVYVDGDLFEPPEPAFYAKEPVEVGNEAGEHSCDCDDCNYCEAIEDNHMRLLDCAARACEIADVLDLKDECERLNLFRYMIASDNQLRALEAIEHMGESC
jgi:hypothetical protein